MPRTSKVNRQSRVPLTYQFKPAAELVAAAERAGHEGRAGKVSSLLGIRK